MSEGRWYACYDECSIDGLPFPWILHSFNTTPPCTDNEDAQWLGGEWTGNRYYTTEGQCSVLFSLIPEPKRGTYYELNEEQIKLVKGYLAL